MGDKRGGVSCAGGGNLRVAENSWCMESWIKVLKDSSAEVTRLLSVFCILFTDIVNGICNLSNDGKIGL